MNATNDATHHRRPGASFRGTTDQGPPSSRRTTSSHHVSSCTSYPAHFCVPYQQKWTALDCFSKSATELR